MHTLSCWSCSMFFSCTPPPECLMWNNNLCWTTSLLWERFPELLGLRRLFLCVLLVTVAHTAQELHTGVVSIRVYLHPLKSRTLAPFFSVDLQLEPPWHLIRICYMHVVISTWHFVHKTSATPAYMSQITSRKEREAPKSIIKERTSWGDECYQSQMIIFCCCCSFSLKQKLWALLYSTV